MQDREGFTDISGVGVCCRLCHKWNSGQSDSCSHCRIRLLRQRPLAPSSVDSWVEGQIKEHDALGIPLLIDDEDLIRRWAAFDPATPGIDQGAADTATHPLVGNKLPADVRDIGDVELKEAEDAGGIRPNLPWWLVAPGVLLISSIVLGAIAVLVDESEGDTLSDIGSAGWLLLLVPLLFLFFMPWLGVSLIVYANRLENHRRRTGMRIGGVAVLLVAASPWIYQVVLVIVWVARGRPQWSS